VTELVPRPPATHQHGSSGHFTPGEPSRVSRTPKRDLTDREQGLVPRGTRYLVMRDVWGELVYVPIQAIETHWRSTGSDAELTVHVEGVGDTVSPPHGVNGYFPYRAPRETKFVMDELTNPGHHSVGDDIIRPMGHPYLP
jgi:hypothetical protein